MTSNTPGNETSDGHETSNGHDVSPHDATGVPVEPIQPASTDDVYDGGDRAAGPSATHDSAIDDTSTDDSATRDSADRGFDGEEREPYPIGATDAEPAPATAADDEMVIDYGSAQEPEHTADAPHEPPLTKPSPADEPHPYPPQALGEPAPVTHDAATVGTGAAAGAGAAAADRDRDADRDADRGSDATSRPVYVQAPTPPKTKGNRGFGVLIGVLATLVFAALYLVALVFVVAPFTVTNAESSTNLLMSTLTSAAFFVPVIVFFLAWVLLVVILTRASWWGYVIGGFFVGLLTYAGALAGLLAVDALEVAPSQVPQFLLEHALDAGAILAFVIAREVPIWFGVWVGKRGRAVRVRNAEARAEYERVLEAGPTART